MKKLDENCRSREQAGLALFSIYSLLLVFTPALSASYLAGSAKFWFTGTGQAGALALLLSAYLLCLIHGLTLWREKNNVRPALILVMIYFLTTCLIQTLVPIQSWDAISGWFAISSKVIAACMENGLNAACEVPSLKGDANFAAYINRHPTFLFWHYAIFSNLGSELQGNVGILLAINLCFFGTSILMLDILGKSNLSSTQILLVAYAGVSFPLLENHRLLIGYAEIVMLAVGFCFLFAIHLFQVQRSWGAAFSVGVLAGIFASLKNISLPILVSILSLALLLKVGKSALSGGLLGKFFLSVSIIGPALLGMLIGSQVAAYSEVYELWLGGNRFGVDLSGENFIMLIGGYRLGVTINDFYEVFSAFFHAFFLNQTFSIVFLLAVFLGYDVRRAGRSEMALSMFLPTVCVVGFVFFVVFVPHGLGHFIPGSDTYGSRYLMFAVSLSVAWWSVSFLSPDRKRPSPRRSGMRAF